ncbi:MAG: diguanylate cyclase [Candidatus Krumholzibacteriia bacterium]
MTSSSDNVLDVILNSDRLPSPSGVALQILELSRNEYASVEDLQRVLVADPALSGQLLKYANSAMARGGNEARTVGEAVVRLGMGTVQHLALGFSLLSASRSGPCAGFDYNRFWSGSLARAIAAQSLAPMVHRTPADEAFTCGLLAGIGALSLASVHSRDYAEVLGRWHNGTVEHLRELEQEALLIDHDEVTVALMKSWGLPERYGDAVMARQEIERNGKVASGLATVLAVAGDLAGLCLATDDRRPDLAEELLTRAEVLGLPSAAVIEATDRALQQWAALGETLDILTEDVPSLTELAERARRKENRTSSPDGAAPEAADEGLLDPDDQPLRVLVVDDSPLDRKLVTTYLTREGHRCEVAANGREGLKSALRWSPHVILSDWMMPEMDGLEMCRALRQSPEVGNVYVMMMTSNDQANDLVTALDAGADDYIPKPINQAVLVARLRAAARVIRLQERTARDSEAIRAYAADLAIANRKLQHMALNDALTGLPNRRYAMERLHKEWDRARRQEKPLLCMILDIDHFKRVNDTYGHDAGDLVLQRTAMAMKACLRSSDDVCRFGGEEFLCICPDADLEMAQVMGDRLRLAVEQNEIDTPQFKGHVTVSIGVAAFTRELESIHDLLKLADEALYAAKDAGRNKVCIVDSASVR